MTFEGGARNLPGPALSPGKYVRGVYVSRGLYRVELPEGIVVGLVCRHPDRPRRWTYQRRDLPSVVELSWPTARDALGALLLVVPELLEQLRS